MLRTTASFVLVLCLWGSATASDTLLKNVMIYDGGGEAGYSGNVRIHNDRIAQVGVQLQSRTGEEVIDEHGLAVAPGFIDMHSHADGGVRNDRGVLDDPNAENVVRQGVTTVFVGQDGFSQYPLAAFLDELQKHPAAINLASQVGHSTLRIRVMGKDLFRPSTSDELAKMSTLLATEMQAGAFGLSTGLEYAPAHSATTEEVIELARVAAAHGGFYTSHVRDEADHVFDSFAEIIRIGKETPIRVEIQHIKLGSVPVWHMASSRVSQVFAEAKRNGVNLRADVYPYTYWESVLDVIVADRDYFNPGKVGNAITDNGGADHLTFTDYPPDSSFNGKTLQDLAASWGVSPTVAYMRVIKTSQDTGKPALVIGASMSEDDVRWLIAYPTIMFCSDAKLHDSHPRGAGTFPRILGHYVRDEHVLSLPVAIHKMTELPARQLGLIDRGRIAVGFVADLVVFNPATVRDEASIRNPQAPPQGMPDVMVSGTWVVRGAKVTGAHPGKVLRRRNSA